jgi:hypothetical protein
MISYLLRGIFEEMSQLAKHGALSSHLPEEPLIHFKFGSSILWQELSGLFGEIEQDSTTLEDADGFSFRSIGINDSRDLIVGLYRFRMVLTEVSMQSMKKRERED